MMEGKVQNGEWRWIDESHCVMHTATPKPALLRARVLAELNVELAVMRHDAHLAGALRLAAREAARAGAQ